MITKDYFLRMISQLAYVLASVLGLMKLKRYDEALEEVQTSSKQLLGMDLRFLTTLSDAEFVRLLSLGDRFDVEKCVVVAELLRVVGDIREEQSRAEDACRVRSTALSLFLELLQQEAGILPQEYYHKVDDLIARLAPTGMPGKLKRKVFEYYERVGKYSKAEDILFEIVEEEGLFLEAGIKFYGRLLEKADAELARGGLPRNEVESGLRDLASRATG